MGKIIKFVDQVAKYRGKEAKRLMGVRLMTRWYLRNRRLMQERDEKRKRQEALQDEQTD